MPRMPATVYRDVLRSHMMRKFQWHLCFQMKKSWKIKDWPQKMFQSCMFSTKIIISEVRAKKRLLVSRNSCVRSTLALNLFWCRISLFSSLYIAAHTGGILGLFMGFSVFSIVEIFYFLTFRPCVHYTKVSKKRRQIMNRKRMQSNRSRFPLDSRIHSEVIESNSVHP